MGLNRLFIPQDVLDEWVEAGKADLRGSTLEVAGEGTYALEPACHFLREAAGGDDPHDLVGRVKEQRVLEALGGEAYMDSALLGDNAYDIRPGFVASPERLADVSASSAVVEAPEAEGAEPASVEVTTSPAVAAEDAGPRPARRGKADSDELAELLLKHLK